MRLPEKQQLDGHLNGREMAMCLPEERQLDGHLNDREMTMCLPKECKLDGHLNEAVRTDLLRLDEVFTKAIKTEAGHLEVIDQTVK